ncbi:MAG: quinone-dependent dihydroorotate dehydrogenase [Myxococcales bacterium]
MVYRALRFLLFLLPAELAHRLALAALRLLGRRRRLSARLRARLAPPLPELGSTCFGLTFENPVGLAAGLDKAGGATAGLFALGFGFVEVGTLTPRPQPGNPPPRLFRVPAEGALVNRMGFNNPGVEAARRLLGPGPWPGPLGVNVGKNRETPEERAGDDYETALSAACAFADYVVVNVSSPNTPGLRRLQDPERLVPLLERLRRANSGRRPLLLKVSPDLEDPALEELVDHALASGVDGLIATNTTLARPDSRGAYRETGGLSGRPLAARSAACLQVVLRRAAGRLPVVSVGGLFTADDVFERLKAGASLVQLYTGFVYGGPSLPGRICRELAQRMRREGFRSLPELSASRTR